MPERDFPGKVQAIAVELVNAEYPLTATELSERTNIAFGTLYRIVTRTAATSLLDFNPITKTYAIKDPQFKWGDKEAVRRLLTGLPLPYGEPKTPPGIPAPINYDLDNDGVVILSADATQLLSRHADLRTLLLDLANNSQARNTNRAGDIVKILDEQIAYFQSLRNFITSKNNWQTNNWWIDYLEGSNNG